jgi:hypothetical protein
MKGMFGLRMKVSEPRQSCGSDSGDTGGGADEDLFSGFRQGGSGGAALELFAGLI